MASPEHSLAVSSAEQLLLSWAQPAVGLSAAENRQRRAEHWASLREDQGNRSAERGGFSWRTDGPGCAGELQTGSALHWFAPKLMREPIKMLWSRLFKNVSRFIQLLWNLNTPLWLGLHHCWGHFVRSFFYFLLETPKPYFKVLCRST